jgi:predicted hotdog family 3-hydroxylacyl-ACP dehydratase
MREKAHSVQEKEMEQNQLLPAEPLIPHRLRMKLIESVKRPTHNRLQAEAIVTEAWPLTNDGKVSSIICIELVAQTVAALSTWRRGKGTTPKIGLLVGVKEAAFPCSTIPVMTKLEVQINELYHVGDYAVFKGKVNSESVSFCETVIQVLEPEKDTLSSLMASRRINPRENETGNGGL